VSADCRAKIANEAAPNSPQAGLARMRHATAIHAVPVITNKIDSVRVGQRRPSHRNAINRQLTAMKTASRRPRGPSGPSS
jgi:hypothetical protein